MRPTFSFRLVPVILALSVAARANSQTIDPRAFSALTWRNLGPFRGGRIAAATGAIGQPGTFYIGLPAGGVWKTTSAGETWYPVFDAVKEVSSIGSVEVAPSDANVIYAGTGDIVTGGAINEGNGIYKSADAGRTWRHIGLDATRQIPTILVDPKDVNVVLVGAQGDLHVKSHDRGVFRSTDGGATWTQTLFVDDSTGLQKLARAFDTPNVIFATSIAHYAPPPPPPGTGPGAGQGQFNLTGPTSTKVFKSTDGGITWSEITGRGLPARLTGKMSVAVANNTGAQRVYLIGDGGLYRSDDGGATWLQMAADDARIRSGQGGYNCGVYVDSRNPDVVYTLSTAAYKSTDGGKTFTGLKGAPGGDDAQQFWIDPTQGERMLFGYDQGAVITLDGGDTWSSWYNQSTEQIYHLSVDNSFPYWVYGTQQDAGAIRTRSRGNQGAITPLDWNPVPGWEWGTIVADPLDASTVYASGNGIVKISYPAETWINVSPAQDPSLKLRTAFSQPIVFTPWDKHMLLAGFQSLWATTDGGATWKVISPDLAARPAPPTATPAPGGPPPSGGIESISPSTIGQGLIWVGTINGMIKVTKNGGKSWDDATVPGLPNETRAEVIAIDASHFDPATAYTAIDLHRVGDYAPYFFRTHDYGKTWTRIVTGMPASRPSGAFARVIRNDTQRKGMLFAGTESEMFISFDDGDHWQSFAQNLPNTSFRDAVIKDNDLVVSTYGRGFWALDDFSMLRQLTPAIAGERAHLFAPGDAVRMRRNVGADTPFPPEVPHALNPAPGAMIAYSLATAPHGEIMIEIADASGRIIRRLSSVAALPVAEAARPPHPNFWVAPPAALAKNIGDNRTNWDLRQDSPRSFTHSFEINANPGLTPPSPEGPMVPPGTYTIRLIVDGITYTQPVTVRPDPRSTASPRALAAQYDLQTKIAQGIDASFDANGAAVALREAIRSAVPTTAPADLSDAVVTATALATRLDSIIGVDRGGRGGGGGGGRGGPPPAPTFRAINGALVGQINAQDLGDLTPTAGALAAFGATCRDLTKVAASWQAISTTGLGALNGQLSSKGRAPIPVPPVTIKPPAC